MTPAPVPSATADPWAQLSAVGSLISAGGAILGLVLATVAAVAAYRLFKVEVARDTRTEERLYRQQASNVGCWFDLEASVDTIVVSNHSMLPIYSGVLIAQVRDLSFSRVGSNKQLIREYCVAGFKVIRPGEPMILELPPDLGEINSAYREHYPPPGMPDVSVEFMVCFTDNAGVRWIRDLNGKLDLAEPNRFVHAYLIQGPVL